MAIGVTNAPKRYNINTPSPPQNKCWMHATKRARIDIVVLAIVMYVSCVGGTVFAVKIRGMRKARKP